MTRLERLSRLHFLCVVSELQADPCTPQRAARGRRADRVAQAYRTERAEMAHRGAWAPQDAYWGAA